MDLNKDNRGGLEDAIYNLEAVAGIRSGAGAQSVSSMRFALSSSQKNVKVWQDTDGDGVDELIQTVTTDTYGYIEIDGLSEGNYTRQPPAPTTPAPSELKMLKLPAGTYT